MRYAMKVIARLQGDFPTKFGLPRQSGLAPSVRSRVVFEPEYRHAEAFRGLEAYSHVWLIWAFSEAVREDWSPTVRPPRLGGNTRMGVFATRSPFRPNPIGLSCVKLERVEPDSPDGPVLHVSGADLMDGTPIFDVKPYLPYADAHPEAEGGFAEQRKGYRLKVELPDELRAKVSADRVEALTDVLAGDPRPSYQHDASRVYGFAFAGLEVRFTVDGDVLRVREIEPAQREES